MFFLFIFFLNLAEEVNYSIRWSLCGFRAFVALSSPELLPFLEQYGFEGDVGLLNDGSILLLHGGSCTAQPPSKFSLSVPVSRTTDI